MSLQYQSTINPDFLQRRSERYQVVGDLGRGAFGRVKHAIDVMTGQQVALKTQAIPSEEAQKELAAYSAFAACPHPNMMRMLDYYVCSGALVTVHELASTTVWALFKAGGQGLGLPRSKWSQYLVDAARGCEHLHALGYVHGDLSFKNMLLAGDPLVLKISDFGSTFVSHTSAAGEEISTAYIRAPEVFLSDMRLTPALDTWASGVFFLLALRILPLGREA